MCSKIIELNKVSDGKVTEHHKMMIKMALEHYDYLQSEIKQIDDRIDLLLEPYEEERALLEQISGIDHDHIASAGIITEIGVDISVFPTDKYISSGAWLSSANNESAGKRLSSKTNPVIDI